MKEGFITICGGPTHIITWGRWVEEPMDDVPELVICITGNPGLVGFYTEFLHLLYEQLGKKIPVWIIGHLGHEEPTKDSKTEVPCLQGNEKIFDLNGQLQHKKEFIQRFVPNNTKIHLIGHSIGAWMVIHLLECPDIRQSIKKCYLLFPTIERMIDSSNGWNFNNIGIPLYKILGFVIPLFNRLPKYLQIFGVQIYFWLLNIPKAFIETALEYSKAPVMEKVIFLAKDEMARVRDLDQSLVEKHLPLLKLYYGTTDGWVPVEYYNEICCKFPDIDAELDKESIDHAFVLRNSDTMARIVCNMIKEHSDLLK
ncbi:lipid droplet-associated hydrolase [Zeugodacus cucurbitae]|uniref:lipid droplet-associated hydrolase n=1 Tax=Zeugodacus cucurbitae TaxID=28588 RepID=UPI0023D91562|nr:lipid droplet-associated hydrolase [Zeugodacus cucurbitae]